MRKSGQAPVVLRHEVEDKKSFGPMDALRQFLHYSTADGISGMERNRNPVARSIWLLLCLVLWSVMVYQCSVACRFYFSHPISVSIRIHHQSVSSTSPSGYRS